VAEIPGGVSGHRPAHLDRAGALHVVPADHKWFRAGGDRLHHRQRAGGARSAFPRVDKASLQEFKQVRKALEHESKGRAKPKAALKR